MNHERLYKCSFCGNEIGLGIDVTAGASQEFIESCPRCHDANAVHVEADNEGRVTVCVTPAPPKKITQSVPFDVVQEASEESFPASDSPAY